MSSTLNRFAPARSTCGDGVRGWEKGRWRLLPLYRSHDAAGNLGYRTNNALVQTFNVNNLNQLTTATRSGSLTAAGVTTVAATNVTVNTLDATRYADNTFARESLSLVDGNNTFTAIAKDNLGRADTNSITAYLPAGPSFSYDLNGNLLSDGRRGFDYDDENQLIRVTVANAWKSEFAYDGKLRRRVRKEFAWQASAWVQTNEVRYVYDGNLVAQERWYNPQISLASPQQIISYTRGTDLSGSFQGAGGIGGLLARTDCSNPNLFSSAFYHCDGNGNVTALVNSNQLIVAKYLYDPYGNVLAQSGPLAEANLYRFSSKEAHPNSGLVYYLYRYYEPNLQRWVNRDPIGDIGFLTVKRNSPRLHEADAANLYVFLWNQPRTRRDPFGLFGEPWNDPMREIEKAIEQALQGAKTAGKCVGLVHLVACASCGLGTLGIEAICTGWKGQGYGSFNDCLCTEMGQNVAARAACSACFAPVSFITDIWGATLGCGGAGDK